MVPTLARRAHDTPDELAASVGHLGVLGAKVARLREAQAETVAQIAHRAAVLYRAGELADGDALEVYLALREFGGSGFSRAWLAAGLPSLSRMRWRVENRPNGSDGSWHGGYPLALTDPAPPVGQCVVYVLYDEAGAPCYVGSTQTLRVRLRQHAYDKRFVRWQAYPAEDRTAAYDMETRFLQSHKPYLNKRATA
jgi:hypothetical protein